MHLSRWKQILVQIPAPTFNDEHKQELYVQALQGDKILGCAVTMTLVNQGGTTPLDTGSLTQVISSTVSNSFLAQQADQILSLGWKSALDLDNLSEWEIGTLVEAAVYAVHKVDPSAVDHLATFLLDSHAQTTERNTKSRLLELGGTVVAERTGGSDHNPVFTATATLESETATAEGPSKKRAEMLAAAQLLDLSDIESSTVWRFPDNDASFTYRKWEPTFFGTNEVNLRGNETVEEWWMRGAFLRKDALYRAMMAPKIFPGAIEAFDAWVWRYEHEVAAAFAMIVATNGSYHTIPAKTATSANKARQLVGLEANRIIAELAGLKIPDDG